MLIITRRTGEKIMVGDDMAIQVMDISGNHVRIGVSAPKSVPVYREEIWASVKQENQAAAAAGVNLPRTAHGRGGQNV